MKFLTSLIAGLACGSKLYLDWSLDFEDAINIGGPVLRENGSIDFMLIERDQKVNYYMEQDIGIFNPYPGFFGTITERVFWKKIQIHHW